MQALAWEKLALVTGWRRNLFAFSLGVMATLTLPPFYLFPLLIPAYAGLYLLLQGAASTRRTFWDGWWWGWGHYITGLYWFCIALLTEPEKFAWLIPFTLFGLMGVIAIYPAVACWLARRLRLKGLTGLFVFAVLWTVVEIARAHLFSGFPWNLPGYAFTVSDALLQPASLIGIYGLSWLAVFVGVAPAALLLLTGDEHPRARYFVGCVAVAIIALGMWGQLRLTLANGIPESERYVPDVRLRLVQANIAQPHKWDPRLQLQGLQEHIKLTQSPGIENVTHVIWPETAVPYVMQPDSTLTRMLAEALPANIHLITGTLRAQGEGENWQVFNSMVDLNSQGVIVGVYDKAKLVPFGEFLPFRSVFPKTWLTPVGQNDFSAGPGMQTLNWPGLPGVSPLICYEVIFPERSVGSEHRPGWLLSITNDAWFGNSTGPYQHFQMARVRSVEQGLPLVRVGNTGISGQVDAYGRVKDLLPLGSKGILDIALHKPSADSTIYSIYKEWFILLLLFLTALLMVNQYKRQTD